ncbi:MAG: hypothetical protein ABIV50_01425 [Opitutus sp.]
MKMKLRFLSALVLPFALTSLGFAAADTYQVTGPVLAINDNSLVVEKSGERWEIARDANTKLDHPLKVGDKVTVHYRMFATTIELKPANAKEPKAERAPSTSKTEKSK